MVAYRFSVYNKATTFVDHGVIIDLLSHNKTMDVFFWRWRKSLAPATRVYNTMVLSPVIKTVHFTISSIGVIDVYDITQLCTFK